MSRQRTFKIIFLIVAAVFLTGIVSAQEDPSSQGYFDYQSPGKTFRCVLPKDWSIYESPDHSREVTKTDGVVAYRGGFKDRVTLSLHYFPAGSKLHKSMDKYIAVHSGPILGAKLEGEDYGPVRNMEWKGKKGKTFQRVVVEYENHVYNAQLGKYVEPLHPRQVSLTETFMVVQAGSGFVAFRFKATPEAAKRYENVFLKVVESFTLIATEQKTLMPSPLSEYRNKG